MANSAQARKRVRQSVKRREHNVALRSRMRTYVKRVLAAIHSQDKDAASGAYQEMCKVIDSAAGKGLIHVNKAARHKSRLNARIKAL